MSDKLVVLQGDLSSELARNLSDAPRIAWDIETSGLDPVSDRIGTVQVYAPTIGTVVVQADSSVPRRLLALLEDQGITKVLHHAIFDLRFMASHWRAVPCNIKCTKIAGKLLEPHREEGAYTLKELLASKLGIRISKAQRLTNWLSVGLTAEQIEYASQDVRHLLTLLDVLESELYDAGRLDLFRACTEFLPARVALELGGWPDVYRY